MSGKNNQTQAVTMKFRVVSTTYPRSEDPNHWYTKTRILGEYATEEEAKKGAREEMLKTCQFANWAEESGYDEYDPPYSTTEADPYDIADEDEHVEIEVEEIAKGKKSMTKK